MSKIVQITINGEIIPKQHRYELSLMGNPRRLTLDAKELEDV
ncbi:MAG: hypothetical protein ACTSYX_07690 [Candidatus Thorarchaeota archaeon]